jgi:hypothetical protein
MRRSYGIALGFHQLQLSVGQGSAMRKILVVILLLILAIPFGIGKLMGFINSSTITADGAEIETKLAEDFGIPVPPGYKGAFGLQIGFFGVEGASIVALIPADADPESIFEGGKSINFSPGEHTIVLAIRSNDRQSEASTYRDLQRFVLDADGGDGAVTEVFIEAGGREVAAYEHRDKRHGQDVLSYFLFLDDGGLVMIAGPEQGFDHGFKETLAAGLSGAWPANDLLYAHVEPPTRDPNHPCGLGALPEQLELQAVGVQRGDRDLEGVAIDPTDDSAGEQAVAVGRTAEPLVLVLMAGEPTVWKVLSTPDANIAGVVASGRGLQRVIGLEPGVPLLEIDPNARNACRSFFAHEDEGREYEEVRDRLFEIFAEPVSRMHTVHGGKYFRIGELTGEPTLKGDLGIEDVLLDPAEQILPGKLGLAQLQESGVLEPATPADLDTWLDGFAQDEDFDAERYRNRHSINFRMGKAFIVKAETDLPDGMYGAHSALFLVAQGVPEPGGDQGHNTLLFTDGRCIGPACP